ncbi:MAG: rolling circle replication-associated protein [Opitutales bacterium]
MTLQAYHPKSWFTEEGRRKILRDLEPRLPDVSGCLFLTLTFDPALFDEPESAYHKGKDRLRRIFEKLRKGIRHEGKTVKINAPYFWKLEFQENGWAHWHLIFKTRRYLPGKALLKLWGYGRVQVKRIENDEFRYLLKYVTKGNGPLPDWFLKIRKPRITQQGGKFLKPKSKKENTASQPGPSRRNLNLTVGERLERIRRTALVRRGRRFFQALLAAPFQDLLEADVLNLATSGEYLGNGVIQPTLNTLQLWLK